MSNAKVKELLQRMNFIETDMEIQKQILFSTPSDNKKDMEKLVDKIADFKQQIIDLKLEIKKIDKTEYKKIVAIEKGTKKFQKISRDKKYIQVNTLNESGECFITLNDGTHIDCLVAAKDTNGNMTILTSEGEAKEYPHSIIKL